MWELCKRVPRGRLSLRSFSLLVTVFLVTFLGISSLFTQSAYADTGAIRNGNNVTYQDNTYTPAEKSQLPKDVVKEVSGTTGYRYVDSTSSKAYFILTTGDASKATSGYYVIYNFTPPSDYTLLSPPQSITISTGTDSGDSGDGGKQASACDGATIGGIGWIVCPTVNFIAKGMDKIYSVISGFLEVKTVTGDTHSSIYQLWSVIRDVANVAFVIAFLAIVYSQITSIGISNYGIKSMLPRLMIAAILVNVSFWVCAAAVDASNALGYSIHELFVGLMNKYSVGGNYTGNIPSWEQVAAIALSGGAIVGGGLFVAAASIGGTVYLLIPFLLGAVVAALVALIVLAARQAMITVMIIVSPLAFVAYVLPNTEKHFNKWREALTTLLVLFPIFSVLFSGAQVAGMAIVQSAGGNLLTIILGMAVQVAPLAITPMLVKFSNGIIGKVASMANNSGKKIVDRSRDWSKARAQEHKNKILADQNRYFRRNPLNHATKALDTRRRRIEGKRKAYESMADNRFADTKQGHTIEAMNRSAANEKQRVENVFSSSRRGRQLELQSRHMGVEKQEIENSVLRSDGGHQLTHRQQLAEVDKTRVGTEFEETQLGDQVDRAKRTAEAEKKRIDNTHQAGWDNDMRTDATLNILELSVKQSEDRAANAKGKLEKMHNEVAVQGENSEHVMNLRNNNPALQQGILQIAKDINTQKSEASLAGMAKVAAEREMNTQVNSALSDNTMMIEGKTVRKYAAGIGSESGVFATAISRERKEFGEEVSYQRELYNHYKLNAVQINDLATGKANAEVKDDSGNVIYTFDKDNEHIRDMAVEDIFSVGSHDQKMAIIKSTAKGEVNYDYRRTIQQAAKKSGISSIAPAISDATFDAIINGDFKGDESWQYHSYREILEGRIKTNTLSTTNASSLNMLFKDVGSDPATKAQFDKLIDSKVSGELADLQVTDPKATESDARASLVSRFDEQRNKMREMAGEVLTNSTISQNTDAKSAAVLEKFSGIPRRKPKTR